MCIWSNIHNRNFALYFILLEINLSIAKPQKFQFKSVILGAEISIFWVWDHSSITSAKRWLGWVRKWHFLLIYSTIHSDVLRWVGLKKTKTSWRNTWMVPKGQLISKGLFDVILWTIKPTFLIRISALASKKSPTLYSDI